MLMLLPLAPHLSLWLKRGNDKKKVRKKRTIHCRKKGQSRDKLEHLMAFFHLYVSFNVCCRTLWPLESKSSFSKHRRLLTTLALYSGQT